MFDLILDKVERPYQRSSAGATVVSMIAHTAIVTTVIVLPLMWATDSLPDVPVMMAFVGMPVAPPPPPPPPPPPAETSFDPPPPPPAPTTFTVKVDTPPGTVNE